MKTQVTIDDRHYATLEDFDLAGTVNFTMFFQMDNGDWVIQGGAILTKEVCANFGLSLIDKSGKGKEMLKAKYQRKD